MSSSSSSSESVSSSSTSAKADTPFCQELDLVEERPGIMGYGVSSWDGKINEATDLVLRDLDYNWYRGAAEGFGVDWRTYPMDVDLLYSSQHIKRLAVYKTLELIYRFLRKDAPVDQDAFEPQMKMYTKLYNDELKIVCQYGVDYDWDSSGGISDEEEKTQGQRRLTRC